jgi:hypothetical protein
MTMNVISWKILIARSEVLMPLLTLKINPEYEALVPTISKESYKDFSQLDSDQWTIRTNNRQ